MGKLVLLSNFRDGYPEMIKKVADKESVIFSYIPSRTEFGVMLTTLCGIVTLPVVCRVLLWIAGS